ncbi:MAG: hypothetical protein JXN60_05935, partial [Lentisphaerae bacterium]|nr:hypothetical protein [Lentisphaerota bacterium]
SQMESSIINQRTVKIIDLREKESDTAYLFQATSSDVVFPGYMKIGDWNDLKKSEEEQEEEETSFPELADGENLECMELLSEEKETQPPARYSEASLVRALEHNGIGRPSTYAQIISTLGNRKYAIREKRTLHPTDLGIQVSTLLSSDLGELFNVGFTATMEESLDGIEKGEVQWTNMLSAFYAQFAQWMKAAKAPPADTTVVMQALTALSHVKNWAPPVARGKRTYSDEKFVQSISKQITSDDKPVTQRQLTALLKIACRYHGDVPEIEEMLKDIGSQQMLKDPDLQPPRETSIRKFEILANVPLEDSTRQFIDSLKSRVDSGRCLTDAQLKALNNVVLSHSNVIQGFNDFKNELDLANSSVSDDIESGPLINALATVTNWKEPVARGKRIFDDKVFYESLSQHFKTKGFLTEKQRAALKKLVKRYKEQISNYDAVAQQFDLVKK